MPSDIFYEKLDNAETDRLYEERRRRKEYCENLFSNMSLEAKVDFLIKQYTKEYCKVYLR